MGGTSSKEIQSSIEAVNNVVNESLLSVTNECKTSVNIPQDMTFSCDNIDNDTIKTLLDAEKDCKGIWGAIFSNTKVTKMTPEQIRAMGDSVAAACPPENYKACVVDGITQDAIVESRSSCTIDAEMVSKLQADMESKMNNSASNEEDSFGKALNNVTKVLNPGGSEEVIINSKTKIINNIKNTIDLDMVNKLIGKYNASQTMSFEGSSFSLKNATQAMTLKIVTDALSKNTTLAEVAAEVSNKAESASSDKQKGLTDMVESITGLIGSPYFLMAAVAGVIIFVYFTMM